MSSKLGLQVRDEGLNPVLFHLHMSCTCIDSPTDSIILGQRNFFNYFEFQSCQEVLATFRGLQAFIAQFAVSSLSVFWQVYLMAEDADLSRTFGLFLDFFPILRFSFSKICTDLLSSVRTWCTYRLISLIPNFVGF